MKKAALKFIVVLLIAGINTTGLLSVSKTAASYLDTETSGGNSLIAGQLDFSLLASEYATTLTAFNLQPGESASRDIEVLDISTIPWQYFSKTDNFSGDTDFCNALALNAFASGTMAFEGSLDLFSSASTTNIGLWNIDVSLPGDVNFQNKTCQFDFIFNGWQSEHEILNYGDGGFDDTESVSNRIDSWGVRINKVFYDVVASRGAEGENEWIEIYNQTDTELDLSGWEICDNNQCDTLPSADPIVANGYAVITPASSTWSYWSVPSTISKIVLDSEIGDGLEDDADMLILKRPDGVVIDQMNWGEPNGSWSNYNDQVWAVGVAIADEGDALTRIPSGHDTNAPEDWTALKPPVLNLVYPNQGGTLTWYWTYSYNITWTAVNSNGDDDDLKVDLYYIKDVDQNGVISSADTIHLIVEDTPNDGTYRWTVPNGFLGYIWIKIIVTGPENPMLNSVMTSGKIYDPFPIEMWVEDPDKVVAEFLADKDKEGELVGEEEVVIEEVNSSSETEEAEEEEESSSTMPEEEVAVEASQTGGGAILGAETDVPAADDTEPALMTEEEEAPTAASSSISEAPAEDSMEEASSTVEIEEPAVAEASSTAETENIGSEEADSMPEEPMAEDAEENASSMPAQPSTPTVIENIEKKPEEEIIVKDDAVEEEDAKENDEIVAPEVVQEQEVTIEPILEEGEEALQEQVEGDLPVIQLDVETGENLPDIDIPTINQEGEYVE